MRLYKFISRRIAKILLYSEPESWRCCHTSVNLVDVASCPDGVKKSESRKLWFIGPQFLRQSDKIPVVESSAVAVKRVTCVTDKNKLSFLEESCIDRMIEAAPSLYKLKKLVAHLLEFVEYFKRYKVKKEKFVKPKFDTTKLDEAMYAIVGYVQHRLYRQALSILQSKSPEDLLHAIDRCSRHESSESKFS